MVIDLDDAQYRRLRAIAGRRGQQPVDLAREIVEKLLQADVPGKINPVIQAIDGRAWHCAYCGRALPSNATRRRKYCGAKCRVAWNRAARHTSPTTRVVRAMNAGVVDAP
jgi:hypothetical protein